MDDSDIVEIYSAANSLEAYALANALKADGIEAKVVNEFVQMGVGLLPLTEPVTPRVWIRKGDEVRARELLEEYEARAENAHTVPESPEMETEESSSDEDAESREESEAIPTAGRTRGFISPLLFMGGIACICIGLFFTFQNHRLLSYYTETAKGQYIKYNFAADESRQSHTPIWYLTYAYKVEGVQHTVVIERSKFPGENITVRYNHKNPADGYADPILHPALCLVLGSVFGGFALFLAYQFRG
jgi:hypothetical protein